MKTTEFISAGKMLRMETPCHEGKGEWYFRDMTSVYDRDRSMLQFMHHDKLPPGSSFGEHTHDPADNGELIEEWYIGLSGTGVMTLDGKEYPFGPGDVTVCRNGGKHGIYNPGNEMMEFLVIGIRFRHSS